MLIGFNVDFMLNVCSLPLIGQALWRAPTFLLHISLFEIGSIFPIPLFIFCFHAIRKNPQSFQSIN
jgi:hypothetical protein